MLLILFGNSMFQIIIIMIKNNIEINEKISLIYGTQTLLQELYTGQEFFVMFFGWDKAFFNNFL